LNFRRKRHKIQASAIQFYLILIGEIAAVVLLAWVLTVSFGTRTVCYGQSMEGTISENAPVWLNRISYRISSPQTGDIIAFKPDGNTTASDSIKRIVAVPGDRVQIRNGKLYVNDTFVEIVQDDTSIEDAGRAATEITLGADEYFVLGDNVNNSEDSRYESIGNVKKSDILGKVWFVLSVPGFGFVE
jgi:signal peptidase I